MYVILILQNSILEQGVVIGPIRPKDIKQVLGSKSSNSAPGPDGISYGILKKLPSIHHFLATLYSKLLLNQNPTPPSTWTEAKVILLHKKDSLDNPENFRMIALSSVFGKIFHQIIVSRLEKYLTKNEFVDTTTQKGFMKGVSGCVDHNVIVHEVIKHAKANKKTAHFTWFDLQDAFGSVPHTLIDHILERYFLPSEISVYIKNLYSVISGKVVTKHWSTDSFRFRKGIFQGDPLSPLIFTMCINPLLEYLKANEKFGYTLNESKYVTTFFADDFCLMTANSRSHQRIMNTLTSHVSSLGLRLKPSKCRSLSIASGMINKAASFQLDGQNILSLSVTDNRFKFLGSLVTDNDNSRSVYEYLSEIITSGLRNIDASSVRSEYKLEIYSRYFLPSLRFHVTVNDLCQSHLKQLDALTNRYAKKWSGLAHPATLAMLHMPEGLDIPSITDLYIECHTQAHVQIRKKGDSKVNNCLDSKIEREKRWTRKVSITTQCEQDWNVIHEQNLSVTQQKRAVKSLCKQRVSDYWRNHVKNLAVQGRTLELISLESGHSQWKSLAYNLPVRVTKFMLNALTDSLNTRANLLRWGKRSNDRCTKCGNRETLHHVLNHCSIALDQGRFTWRHNNVLHHIVEVARSGIHRNAEVVSDTVIYSDLAGDARPAGLLSLLNVHKPT